MITDKGDLNILQECHRVTWFSFLKFSRETAWADGGWNHSGPDGTYWQSRGLKSLVREKTPAEFLAEWTRNSLCATGIGVRQRESRFARPPSNAHKTILSESPSIDAKERKLNRWLFKKGKVRNWGTIVGYEVPLTSGSKGQLKIDLLAVSTSPQGLTIIELKEGSNKNHSPLLALIEAICYAIQTIRCKDVLCGDPTLKKHGITKDHFGTIRLVLAAPASYWQYWGLTEAHPGKKEDIVSKMNAIVTQVSKALPNKECQFLLEKICRLEPADLMQVTTPGTPEQ